MKKLIIWNLLWLFSGLLIAELGVRALKPDIEERFSNRLFKPSQSPRDLKPNVKIRHSKKIDGELIFDVEYNTDQFGNRIAPTVVEGKKHALFVGGSFTFGYGVDDHQTLPSQFQKLSGHQSYNFGVPSWGTFNVLADMERQDLKSQIRETTGAMFYVFINAHFRRSHGVNFHTRGFRDFPIYRWEADKLEKVGTVETVYPISSTIAPYFFKTHLLKSFDLKNWLTDWRRTPKTEEAWVQAVLKMRAIYHQAFPKGRFFFVKFPGTSLDRILEGKLRDNQISFLAFDDIRDPLIHKYDTHPIPETYQEVATRLLQGMNAMNFNPL